jgi:hypothetical protein
LLTWLCVERVLKDGERGRYSNTSMPQGNDKLMQYQIPYHTGIHAHINRNLLSEYQAQGVVLGRVGTGERGNEFTGCQYNMHCNHRSKIIVIGSPHYFVYYAPLKH